MITLYDYELSSDCYKVRLFAEMLGVALRRVPVDVYPGREHRSDAYLAIDPFGELPVIEDSSFKLRHAHAILVYLAGRYDSSGRWYDLKDPAMLGRIGEWLAFAEGLASTAAKARLHDNTFEPADIEGCRANAHALLRVLDEHLWFAEEADWGWLCGGDHPTIADVACFPDVVLSEEGGISRMAYPAIRRWTDRVKRIPRFTLMPGVFFADPFVVPETNRVSSS